MFEGVKSSLFCNNSHHEKKHGRSYYPDISFNVFPNPADDVFTLHLLKHFLGDEIKISDVMGREIYSGHFSTEYTKLNTSHFADGIYFIQLIRSGKETELNIPTKKLIILL